MVSKVNACNGFSMIPRIELVALCVTLSHPIGATDVQPKRYAKGGW